MPFAKAFTLTSTLWKGKKKINDEIICGKARCKLFHHSSLSLFLSISTKHLDSPFAGAICRKICSISLFNSLPYLATRSFAAAFCKNSVPSPYLTVSITWRPVLLPLPSAKKNHICTIFLFNSQPYLTTRSFAGAIDKKPFHQLYFQTVSLTWQLDLLPAPSAKKTSAPSP